jgi:hypothetical protein
MTNEQIIQTFKDILDKNSVSFVTPPIMGQSFFGQGINFDIVNSIPDKTKRTYLKVDSIQSAKKIWIEVLKSEPKEKEVDKVFDKYIPTNLDLSKDLFLSIYSGQK